MYIIRNKYTYLGNVYIYYINENFVSVMWFVK